MPYKIKKPHDYPKGDLAMEPSGPTLNEWETLYRSTLEFKETAPWEWMDDSEIFGVQNPLRKDETGYCCVMGAGGELFGLAVYLGTEGLEVYKKVISGEIGPGDMDALFLQKCLMVTFEGRDALGKEELAIIKSLNLRFRGANAWPVFRSYQPGFEPWFLNREEALFLTEALRQAIDVVLRVKDNAALLIPSGPNHYLVRVRSDEGWRDEWLKPAPLMKPASVIPVVNEIRLQKIKKEVPFKDMVWEVDFFNAPFAVAEGGRPFYPYISVALDAASHFALNMEVAALADYASKFQELFLGVLEKHRVMPREVQVGKEEALALLEPITSKLGIRIKRVERLKGIALFRREMQSSFPR